MGKRDRGLLEELRTHIATAMDSTQVDHAFREIRKSMEAARKLYADARRQAKLRTIVITPSVLTAATKEDALVALRNLTARGPNALEKAYSDEVDAMEAGFDTTNTVDPQRIVDAAGQAGVYDMSEEGSPRDDTE